jgi:hypothetical protein
MLATIVGQVQLLGLVSILPSRTLQSPIYFLAFWAGAFLSLCLAVVGLMVFLDVIESDSELMTLAKELALAAAASAIEAVGAWALAAFVPAALVRGIFLPLIVAGLLYQVAHYDRWGRYEVGFLFMLQIGIVLAGVAALVGEWQLTFAIVGCYILFLAIVVGIIRSL